MIEGCRKDGRIGRHLSTPVEGIIRVACSERIAYSHIACKVQAAGGICVRSKMGLARRCAKDSPGNKRYKETILDHRKSFAELGIRNRRRSEEHTSELQSRGLISYAVF